MVVTNTLATAVYTLQVLASVSPSVLVRKQKKRKKYGHTTTAASVSGMTIKICARKTGNICTYKNQCS